MNKRFATISMGDKECDNPLRLPIDNLPKYTFCYIHKIRRRS